MANDRLKYLVLLRLEVGNLDPSMGHHVFKAAIQRLNEKHGYMPVVQDIMNEWAHSVTNPDDHATDLMDRGVVYESKKKFLEELINKELQHVGSEQ